VFGGSKNLTWGQNPELVMDGALNYLFDQNTGTKDSNKEPPKEDLYMFSTAKAAEGFENTLLSLTGGKN
jgi:hypothetical protein